MRGRVDGEVSGVGGGINSNNTSERILKIRTNIVVRIEI